MPISPRFDPVAPPMPAQGLGGDGDVYPRSGRWYATPMISTPLASASIPALTTLASQWVRVAGDCTVSDLGVSVTVAAPGNTFRLGIYADCAGEPGSLLAETDTLSAASVAVVTGAIPATDLYAGHAYWLALLTTNGAVSFVTQPATSVRGMHGLTAIAPGAAVTGYTASAQADFAEDGRGMATTSAPPVFIAMKVV